MNNNHRLRMRDADKILKKVKEAELLCRDRLIESYFLCEIIDNMIIEAIGEMKKEKWFKSDIKHSINVAKNISRRNLMYARQYSSCDKDGLLEASDRIYEMIKMDLYKMGNGCEIELAQQGVENARIMSIFICLKYMFYFQQMHVQTILDYVKENILNYDFGKFYSEVDSKDVDYWWTRGFKLYVERYVHDVVDIDNIQSAKNGILSFAVHFTKTLHPDIQ